MALRAATPCSLVAWYQHLCNNSIFIRPQHELSPSRTTGHSSVCRFCRPVDLGYEYSLLKADSHIACRAHAVPLPCRSLIHTYHAAPLPCSDSAVSFVKVRMVAGNIRTASPTVLTDPLFCSVLLPLFTVVGMDRCEEDWYASDNNLRGTPRGSRKKPNAGK